MHYAHICTRVYSSLLFARATSTFAWFQATEATNLTWHTDPAEQTAQVTYEQFSASVEDIEVTFSWTEMSDSGTLRLTHYGVFDTDKGAANKWNHAYVTAGGSLVVNSNDAPATAYGKGASAGVGATQDYKIYKLTATWNPSADQIAGFTDSGTNDVGVTVSVTSPFKVWKSNTTLTATIKTGTDNSTVPSSPNTSVTSTISLGVKSGWTAGSDNTADCEYYFYVFCDGVDVSSNENQSTTLTGDATAHL